MEKIREEIRQKKGIDLQKVVMTSDEKDPEWWRQVREQGWYAPDHVEQKTAELMGEWYAAFLPCYFSLANRCLLKVDTTY